MRVFEEMQQYRDGQDFLAALQLLRLEDIHCCVGSQLDLE
jgi:hypothetical protein